MGTLFEQRPRDFKTQDADQWIDYVKDLAKKNKMPIGEVIEILKVAEMYRQNTVYVANGDIHDEQMAGFGELLRELIGLIKGSC